MNRDFPSRDENGDDDVDGCHDGVDYHDGDDDVHGEISLCLIPFLRSNLVSLHDECDCAGRGASDLCSDDGNRAHHCNDDNESPGSHYGLDLPGMREE